MVVGLKPLEKAPNVPRGRTKLAFDGGSNGANDCGNGFGIPAYGSLKLTPLRVICGLNGAELTKPL